MMNCCKKFLKKTLQALVGFIIGFIASIAYGASYSTFEEALRFAPIAGTLLGILCFIFGEKFLDSLIKGL